MPTYEYRCKKCGQRFERTEGVAEHGSAKPRCPKCGSEGVIQVLTPFYARTSRKS